MGISSNDGMGFMDIRRDYVKEISVKDANVNILLDIGGEVHIVGFEKERLEAIEFLIKSAVKGMHNTGKRREEFLEFLGVKG